MRRWCDVCLGPCAYGREHVDQFNPYTLGRSPQKGPRSRLELLRRPDGRIEGGLKRLARTPKRIFNEGREDVGPISFDTTLGSALTPSRGAWEHSTT